MCVLTGILNFCLFSTHIGKYALTLIFRQSVDYILFYVDCVLS